MAGSREVSLSERNLLGTGRFAKVSATYGQYIRSVGFDYAEPYFLDYRSSMGLSLFAKQTLANSYLSYGTESYGGTLKWGLPLREDLGFQLRYSLYEQIITLPTYLNDCNNLNPDFATTFPTPAAVNAATNGGLVSTSPPLWANYPGALAAGTQTNCFQSSQASLPVRVELAQGGYLTSYDRLWLLLQYVGQQQAADERPLYQLRPGLRRRRRHVSYLRTTVDVRGYYEVVTDLVSILHLQGGDMLGLAIVRKIGAPAAAMCACSTTSRWAQPRPRLPAGGPRSARCHARNDERQYRRHDVLGRQPRIPVSVLFPAQGQRLPRRRLRRFRIGLGLQRRDDISGDWRNQRADRSGSAGHALRLSVRHAIRGHPGRARLGRRQHDLGFAVRTIAFRFRLSVPQAELRPDAVVRLRRRNEILIATPALARTAMPDFVRPNCELTTGEIAAFTHAVLRDGDPADRSIRNIAPLDTARPTDISFLDSPKFLHQLAVTRAGACFVAPRFAAWRHGRGDPDGAASLRGLRRGDAEAVSRCASSILAVRRSGRAATAQMSPDRPPGNRRHR